MGHCQVILRLERRCVRFVRSRRNSVRNRAAIAPIHPHVSNACATVLRRNCPNGVSRTGGPGKRLCGTMRNAINSEGETCGICSDTRGLSVPVSLYLKRTLVYAAARNA